jgi:hypothetical protein
MTSNQSRKRTIDEQGNQLTEDQIEQMHVKGKLKKYSRARFVSNGPDDNNALNNTNYDEESDTDDSDDDILMTTTAVNNNHENMLAHAHHPNPMMMNIASNQDHNAYTINQPQHISTEHEFAELMNLRPSLDQYRTEIAFRLERERNRLETEVKHERSRNERAKYLDSLQLQKDQILLQFIQEHLDARAYVLRNIQYIAAKVADRL